MEEGKGAAATLIQAASSSSSSPSSSAVGLGGSAGGGGGNLGLSRGQKIVIFTAVFGLTAVAVIARYFRRPGHGGSKGSRSNSVMFKGGGDVPDGGGFARFLRPGSVRSSTASTSATLSPRNGGGGGDHILMGRGRSSISSASIITQSTLVSLDPGVELNCTQLGILGMETLDKSLSFWEESLRILKEQKEDIIHQPIVEDEEGIEQCDRTINQLEEIIGAAKNLQRLAQDLYLDDESVLYAESERASSYGRGRLRSVSSVESFMSAEDILSDDEDIRHSLETAGFIPGAGDSIYPLYEAALRLVEAGAVPFRSLKTEMVGCTKGDQEYLAKLHCLRGAFSRIVSDGEKRQWISMKGKEVFSKILLKADKDPLDFELSYDAIISWCQESANWGLLEIELKDRGLRALTFYDIVLDYVLLDAFEDLESPPMTVLTVTQNRWLSNSFKETALGTAVWSVLKTKKKWLKYQDGFIGHFYNLSDHIMPTLAWGFLGPATELQELCFFFKDKFLEFLRAVFSFEGVRYTTLDELAEDVFKRLELMHSLISHRIAETPTP